MVERQTVGRGDHGRASDRRSRRPWFESTCRRFEAISFNLHGPCLLGETLKSIRPFYLMSMPVGKVKNPTQGLNV